MWRKAGTALIIAMAFTAISAGRASAQNSCTGAGYNPNAGPFCIDGVVTDSFNSGVATTANPPGPQALVTVDPSGNSKELSPINGSTTKVGVINRVVTPCGNPPLAPCGPVLGFTNQNAQVDLNKIYTQTAKAPSGDHIWYYFGWVRDSSSGSGFISIEFQQNAAPVACAYPANVNDLVLNGSTVPPAAQALIDACNPWRNRSDGDFVILWDQSGSKTQIIKRVFRQIPGQPAGNLQLATCPSPIPTSGDCQDLSAVGSAVAQYTADLTGGEAAVDLTASVFPNDGSCQSFANIIPNTVTGNSDTADYKDTVLRRFPPVTNCGSLKVTKITSPAGAAGTFTYTLSRASGDIYTKLIDTDCPIANNDKTTCTGTLTTPDPALPAEPTATDVISNILPGVNYNLTEANPGPTFALTSIVCITQGGSGTSYTYPAPQSGNGFPFSVDAGSETQCTITNTRQSGFLDVIKIVKNDFGLSRRESDFSFKVNGGTDETFVNGSCAGSSPQTCTSATNSRELSILSTYTVQENAPGFAGYEVTYSSDQSGHSMDCTDLSIPVGQRRTCTITNTATINATVGVATRQRIILHDRVVLTNLRRGSGETAGTVTVNLYSGNTCVGNPIGTATLTLPSFATDPGTSLTLGTTTFTPADVNNILFNAPGTTNASWSWTAKFNGNNFNAPEPAGAPACNESTAVTVVQ